MIDINERMAELRKEADDKYSVSKDIGKEAAILYARIEKIHSAKKILDIVKEGLLAHGIPDDLSESICQETLSQFVEEI